MLLSLTRNLHRLHWAHSCIRRTFSKLINLLRQQSRTVPYGQYVDAIKSDEINDSVIVFEDFSDVFALIFGDYVPHQRLRTEQACRLRYAVNKADGVDRLI